jgi:hypothetical protein
VETAEGATFADPTAKVNWRTYIHYVDTMIAKVRRWGNGLALRVHKKDLESAGVSEGDVVQIELLRPPQGGRLDLDTAPTFEDDDPRASIRHDRYLYR